MCLERKGDDVVTALGIRKWPRRLALAIALAVGLAGGFLAAYVGGAARGAPGGIDIGFCQDMGTHHEQAVLMSNLADSRATPAVKALAIGILVGQSQELGLMRGWLQLWHRPATSSAPMVWMPGGMTSHKAMGDMAPSPDGMMPGMATPEQLTDLWAKAGPDFDVLFLQLMIRHHQAGVAMARYAALHADLDAVRQAAQSMTYQQIEDIGQMQALLKGYGATLLPPP